MFQLSDNSTMDEINIVVNAFVFQSNGVKISFPRISLAFRMEKLYDI